ncbi:MAG: hypothetical protein FWE06_00120 [Oscillospiraceae bacterium]|nr:hypothetical protein [Oscillospiraceae bacterium]
MTEKSKARIDDLIALLPDNEKDLYRNIAEYATKLGYSPAKVKDKYEPVVFARKIKNNSYNRLCKISPPNPLTSNDKTTLALKFYATSDYSDIFHEGVKRECESRKTRVGIESGCNGKCGGCYTYIYPNGKKIACCHDKLIILPTISDSYLIEIKNMMKTQNDFLTKHRTDGSAINSD